MVQLRILNILLKFGEKSTTVRKVYVTEKAIKKIQIDPKLETADIDTNNTWPKQEMKSKFTTTIVHKKKRGSFYENFKRQVL
jgi:hypothetical protein